MRCLCALLALFIAPICLAAYCPPDSPQSGGMRDIMLIYLGGDRWSEADFLPYVAHLDKAKGGEPDDWFYDSWLFLQFGGAPSGGAYAYGTANKADWDAYYGKLFEPGRSLAALDACIESVSAKLGPPERACPVILMIPHLDSRLKDFGGIDGVAVDASKDADRLRAFSWAVDEMLARWNARSYRHLKLWGFYWMNEGIGGGDADVARGTAEYVHKLGYGLHWIPWFSAPGFRDTRDFGLDFTIMQPNFAFITTPAGAVVPDEDRLSHNAELCREYGLGVEMETHEAPAANSARRLNLQLYLNHGVDELDGYMNGAVRAYYQGSSSFAGLYESNLPAANRVYDDLYRFHKGTYQRRPVSLCEGSPVTLNGEPCPRLTDGVWLTRGERIDRVATATAPATVEVDLQAAQVVSDVRVHLVAAREGEPREPVKVTLFTSPEGEGYSRAAETQVGSLREMRDWQAGFVILTCNPRTARHLRIEITGVGASVGVDEVVAFPAPHLLSDLPYEITGSLAPDAEVESGVELTDGRLSPQSPGLRFSTELTTVAFDLKEDWYLGQAAAHVDIPEGASPPECRVRAIGKETVVSEWEKPGEDGWMPMPFPRTAAKRVEFELKGSEGVVWDELQVQRAENLAARKPYELRPSFAAQYPDDGGELTDGVLTQTGFGDGKTVGWFGQRVGVMLDLGDVRELDTLAAFVQGGGYAAVYAPDLIRAWTSTDGEDWQLVMVGPLEKEVISATPVGGEQNELCWLRAKVEAKAGRFVRLQFDGQGWLMLSELQVLAGGENLAAGCKYHLQPMPRSEEKYADDGARLTDGDYCRPGEGWGKAVGWSSADPEIIVDLLQPTQVSTVRLHCLGGGQAGIYFPRSLTVATSIDGVTWSDEATFTHDPDESRDELIPTFLTLELEPRDARYVRYKVAGKGWRMVDELEAY